MTYPHLHPDAVRDFDSDEATFGEGWKWGDVDQLQLWIHANDLARHCFDNTQLYCNTA